MSVFIVMRVMGRKKKRHKLRPYKSERRRTITETGLLLKKKFNMVCKMVYCV